MVVTHTIPPNAEGSYILIFGVVNVATSHHIKLKERNNMPYKRILNRIYVKHRGKWSLKQKCKSVKNAKSALRLLRSIEHKEE